MTTPKKDDWLQKKWRPMMAVMYMVVCIFDFIVFPIFYTLVQFWEIEAANDAFRQWDPITLGSGGLFHMAMGAVLGVAAWSRGQEKIAGVASNRLEPIDDLSPVSYRQPMRIPSGMAQEVRVGYGGKHAPPDSYQPLI